MTDWRGRGEGPDQTKLALGAGIAAGLLVLGWMFMARSGEERLSSNGFSFGGPAPLAGPAKTAPAANQTGLSMVRFGFTDAPPAARPEAVPAGSASAPDASPAGGPPQEASPAPAAPAATPPGSEKDLAALGVSAEPKSLSRLGGEKGLLSAVVAKALEHPSALRYLLNNKTLVDAYFSRGLVQQNCSSGAALKSYLMNGSDPQGVSEEISIARTLLSRPDAASAAMGTEFASRLMSCPSVAEVGRDPGAALAIAGANPAAMGLLSDPNTMKALSSNPQALSLLGSAQSSLAGGAPPARP